MYSGINLNADDFTTDAVTFLINIGHKKQQGKYDG